MKKSSSVRQVSEERKQISEKIIIAQVNTIQLTVYNRFTEFKYFWMTLLERTVLNQINKRIYEHFRY